MVHATGDPALADALVFSRDAISQAVDALQEGSSIICDVKMVAAGVAPTAVRMGIDVSCQIDAEETRKLAQAEGITRGAAGIRRAANRKPGEAAGLAGAIIAIGNAPTALFECLRLCLENGVRPAMIVGVPVGFVGAAESKQALMESGLPYVTLPGNRGGSNVAVAIVNALMRLTAAG